MTVGVVLAGGSSSRMGRSKAGLAFEGRTFLDRVASALLAVTSDVIAVGGPSGSVWPTIADEGAPRRGPLSGIVTALRHADSDVLVVAVDHPLVEAATLRRLAELGDDRPVIPLHDDVPQIACAWYPRLALESFAAELDREGFVRRALDPMEVRWVLEDEWRSWGEDGRSWHSVDTPEAYSALRAVSLRE